MLTEQSKRKEQQVTLFDPINIGKLRLQGRMAKSATVETLCTKDGYITDEYLQFYEDIAAGQTPLIITGAASYNSYSSLIKSDEYATFKNHSVPKLIKLFEINTFKSNT